MLKPNLYQHLYQVVSLIKYQEQHVVRRTRSTVTATAETHNRKTTKATPTATNENKRNKIQHRHHHHQRVSAFKHSKTFYFWLFNL